jgi:hypothetical protein
MFIMLNMNVKHKYLLIPVPLSSRYVVSLLEEDVRTGLHSRKCDETRVVSPDASVFISTTCIGSEIDSIVVASAILPASPRLAIQNILVTKIFL